MDVRVRLTGVEDRRREVEWPEGWPIPPIGVRVSLPGVPHPLAVRDVEWMPEGDEEGTRTPYVYLVIGPRPTYLR